MKIEVDTKIMIEIKERELGRADYTTSSIKSTVEKVLRDDNILIHTPIHKGSYYLLSRGSTYLMYFFKRSSMYSVEVKYLGQINDRGQQYSKLKVVGEAKSDQRRSCFRLKCAMPVSARTQVKPQIGEIEANWGKVSNNITVDISDGGMTFATNEKFAIGDIINLEFDIGTVENIDAEVLRVVRAYEGSYRQKISVEFFNECNVQKERFYQYILSVQKKNL